MDKPVIILGAGGIARAAAEIFLSNNIMIYCFLDNDSSLHGKKFNNITVMGKTDNEEYLQHIGKECEAFVAEDDNAVKKSLVRMLTEKRKVMPVNAIHQKADFSEHFEMGHGNFINAGTYFGTASAIGSHCIIHAGAIIDYNTNLGDFVQVGAGSIINSNVSIADEVFVGSGVTVVSGIKIGKGARVGAGSVVVNNVDAGSTVFGNPAASVDT